MTEEKYGDSYGEKFKQYEDRIAELEKENAELKADNDARKFAMVMSEKVEKQLREENAELRAKESFVGEQNRKLCEQQQKIEVLEAENAELKSNFRICEKNADTYYDKLQKAKKLLKHWVELYKPKLEGYPITPIQEQTEQFLSEVEK